MHTTGRRWLPCKKIRATEKERERERDVGGVERGRIKPLEHKPCFILWPAHFCLRHRKPLNSLSLAPAPAHTLSHTSACSETRMAVRRMNELWKTMGLALMFGLLLLHSKFIWSLLQTVLFSVAPYMRVLWLHTIYVLSLYSVSFIFKLLCCMDLYEYLLSS